MINIPNYSEYDHYQKTYLRSANTRQSDRLIPININFPKIENGMEWVPLMGWFLKGLWVHGSRGPTLGPEGNQPGIPWEP